MANAYFYSNLAVQTTLAGSISNVALTITVSATTGFPGSFPYILALDFGGAAEELVKIIGAAGTVLTIDPAGRGFGGTSAQSHSLGAVVRHVYNAVDATDFRTHEASTGAVHGLTGNIVGTTDTQTLTNKTLVSPTINGTVTGPATYTGMTNVPTVAANPGLVVKGLASQSGNLQEWRDSSNNLLGAVTAAGNVNITPVTGGASGTPLLVNEATGFTGSLLDLQVNAASKFNVSQTGLTTMPGGWSAGTGTPSSVGPAGDITLGGTLVFGLASLNGYLGVGGSTFIKKSGDTSRANTTTLSADPDLNLVVNANFVYQLDAYLAYTGEIPSSPGDFKIDWTLPAGASMSYARWGAPNNAANTIDTVQTNGSTIRSLGTYGNTTDVTARPVGVVTIGGTGGSLVLRWAQNTSNATATILRSSSWLRITRLA